MSFANRATSVAVTAAFVFAAAQSPSAAAPNPHLWDNCTHYNHKYPHGVGKRHAHDHTSGTPVTNFLHSTRKYRIAMRHNSDLDRDGDGIACEKA
jgi:hypothetical protein